MGWGDGRTDSESESGVPPNPCLNYKRAIQRAEPIAGIGLSCFLGNFAKLWTKTRSGGTASMELPSPASSARAGLLDVPQSKAVQLGGSMKQSFSVTRPSLQLWMVPQRRRVGASVSSGSLPMSSQQKSNAQPRHVPTQALSCSHHPGLPGSPDARLRTQHTERDSG